MSQEGYGLHLAEGMAQQELARAKPTGLAHTWRRAHLCQCILPGTWRLCWQHLQHDSAGAPSALARTICESGCSCVACCEVASSPDSNANFGNIADANTRDVRRRRVRASVGTETCNRNSVHGAGRRKEACRRRSLAMLSAPVWAFLCVAFLPGSMANNSSNSSNSSAVGQNNTSLNGSGSPALNHSLLNVSTPSITTTPLPTTPSTTPPGTTPMQGSETNLTQNITIIENITVVNITQVDTEFVVTQSGLDEELGRLVDAFKNPKGFFQTADLDEGATTTLWFTCVFFVFFAIGIALDRSRYKRRHQNNHNLLLLVCLTTCLNYLMMANGQGRIMYYAIKEVEPYILTRF